MVVSAVSYNTAMDDNNLNNQYGGYGGRYGGEKEYRTVPLEDRRSRSGGRINTGAALVGGFIAGEMFDGAQYT